MYNNNFLNELNENLRYLPQSEKNDIIQDYQEHFRVGKAEGLTESEIIKKLGSPHSIAKQYLAEYHIEIAKQNSTPSNVGRAIFSTVALGFFNLVFILGPFIGLIGAYIGLWGGAIGLFLSGVALFNAGIFGFFPFFVSRSFLYIMVSEGPIASGIFGIGLATLGLLGFIGLYRLGKILSRLAIRYLNWNILLIKGR